MGIVIIEGPDGAGKTTLLNRLFQEVGSHEKGPRACTSDNGPIDDLRGWVDKDMLTWAKVNPNIPRIYDRYPLISEPIYGALIRGFLPAGFDDLDWFGARWATMRATAQVIYCLPPIDVVMANVMETHQADTEHLKGVIKKCSGIWWQYHIAAARHTSAAVWDYTQPNKNPFSYIKTLVNGRH